MTKKLVGEDGEEFEAFEEFRGMDDDRGDDEIIEMIDKELTFEEEMDNTIEKINEFWKTTEVHNGYTPRSDEESKKKVDAFWEVGRIIADFYDTHGYKRRKCPKCGYWSREVDSVCGGGGSVGKNELDEKAMEMLEEEIGRELTISDFQKGCGYEFEDSKEKNKFHTSEKQLEKHIAEHPDSEIGYSSKTLAYMKHFYRMFPDQEYNDRVRWSVYFDLGSFSNLPKEVWEEGYRKVADKLAGGGKYKEYTRKHLRLPKLRYQLNPRKVYAEKQG